MPRYIYKTRERRHRNKVSFIRHKESFHHHDCVVIIFAICVKKRSSLPSCGPRLKDFVIQHARFTSSALKASFTCTLSKFKLSSSNYTPAKAWQNTLTCQYFGVWMVHNGTPALTAIIVTLRRNMQRELLARKLARNNTNSHLAINIQIVCHTYHHQARSQHA